MVSLIVEFINQLAQRFSSIGQGQENVDKLNLKEANNETGRLV